MPGVTSALAERLTGGRYIDIKIDRDAAARYGMNIADVQSIVSSAVGGDNIGETIEGLQRFPINVRYPRDVRDSIEKIRNLSVLTERGAQIRLSDVAAITVMDGPPMLRSENARLSGWVYVDIRGRDLKSAVVEMQRAVAGEVVFGRRLFGVVVGAVRIPGARHRQTQGRGAGHAGHHFRAALSHVPARR